MQADKMASLGILVSGVAHEINNPNGLILLNIPLIADAFRDAEPILDDYYGTTAISSSEGFPIRGSGSGCR